MGLEKLVSSDQRVRGWRERSLLITGGAGFLGSYLVTRMRAAGHRQIIVPRSQDYDLTREASVERLYGVVNAAVVIHLAARVRGIGAKRAQPGRFFYDNLTMVALLMEHARRQGVEKFVTVGTLCVYPQYTPVPFRETDPWNGYPEETNAPYGLAKKMHLVQAQAYRQQYGFNATYLLPVNLYGPGDHTDPLNSHVIPALIRQCIEASNTGAASITAWGDGSPIREFLYVEDAAHSILLAAKQYDGEAPVNMGRGTEISIRDLVRTICRLTGFSGDLIWDASQPNGQPRRCLDTSCAEAQFGFHAQTPFEEGRRRTVEWYEVACRTRQA